jgi:GAF domain-containing protein
VLQGEDPLTARSGELRFRRVAVRDAATDATVGFAVGDLITRPTAGRSVAALLRGEPLLARNPAEMRQADMVPSHVATLLDRGVHTVMLVPLTAHGVTLGIAVLSRAEHPGPYDEAHLRLVADLAARAAVHIDNAPRARRGGDLAAQPAAPRHPAGGRPGHRLPTATGRPAKPRRSAATGSTSSRSTTARWRWWSAT